MGCVYSKKRKETLRKNKTVNTQPRQKYLPANTGDEDRNGNSETPALPELSDRQKELVKESWTVIKEDMDTVGINMLLK